MKWAIVAVKIISQQTIKNFSATTTTTTTPPTVAGIKEILTVSPKLKVDLPPTLDLKDLRREKSFTDMLCRGFVKSLNFLLGGASKSKDDASKLKNKACRVADVRPSEERRLKGLLLQKGRKGRGKGRSLEQDQFIVVDFEVELPKESSEEGGTNNDATNSTGPTISALPDLSSILTASRLAETIKQAPLNLLAESFKNSVNAEIAAAKNETSVASGGLGISAADGRVGMSAYIA